VRLPDLNDERASAGGRKLPPNLVQSRSPKTDEITGCFRPLTPSTRDRHCRA
jgi:hypothetical protein